MDLTGESLQGKRISVVGKLGGLTKKDTLRLIRQQGGRVDDRPTNQTEVIVLGADHPLTDGWTDSMGADVAEAVQQQRIEVIGEVELWQRLGMVAEEIYREHQLYTPAMMADLVNVPVRLIRRWHRSGLIQATEEIHRLPYFNYQQVVTARQLAQWMKEGATVQGIQTQLAALAELIPDRHRNIQELAIVADGRRLLLRQDRFLVESSGQVCMDFDALTESPEDIAQPSTLSLETLIAARESSSTFRRSSNVPMTLEEMVSEATSAEDENRLEIAIEWYRTAMAAHGPTADLNFQIAELLYRTGDISAARERYYCALELNPDLVEARANLGCVLSEMGQIDLAIAAFEGTLAQYEEYADVHYLLARALEETQAAEKALPHWRRFLQLAPASPWADAARKRLEQETEVD